MRVNRLRTYIRTYLVACVIFLAGCASSVKQAPVSKQADPNWPQHVTKMQSQTTWHAKGRLAVTKGNNKGGNASFVWQQVSDRYHIQMHGPFGSGAAVISGGPKQVFAKESNGKKHHASTPEALMQQLVGWQVPLSGLQYWIRGVPIPNVKVSMQSLNSQGLLKNLVQEGWSIHYIEYGNDNLPKKMQLNHANLKIKLVVTSWSE